MAVIKQAIFELLDVPERGVLSEGPWWSVSQQRLYWIDILGRRLHAADLDGHDLRTWGTPSQIGFAVPDEEGGVVLGLHAGLARLDPATGAITHGFQVETRLDHRINDGAADRHGRLWFGTMHMPETEPSASLFRADSCGVTAIFDGVITSNGLGWSPDDTVMYHTDSGAHLINAFDFDAASGTLSNRRVFAQTPADYVPDGMTVDADGCVWSACWGGHRLIRHAPDGRALLELRFPVARITSCAFAGPRLDVLVVTSARDPDAADGDDREPLAGRVFLLDVGVTGLPQTPVARIISAAIPPNRPQPTRP